MAKILIGVTYYSPHISGLTNYAKILAEELTKRGNDVRVISSQFSKNLKPKGRKEIKMGFAIRIRAYLNWGMTYFVQETNEKRAKQKAYQRARET